MIARVWSGTTRARDADSYAGYLERTGVPDLNGTPGNRGVYVLRSVEGQRATFVVLSLWETLDTIRAFAGEEVDRAKYYPEDHRFLLHLPERVTHYEVVEPALGVA